jgi:hypothetical protein
MEVQLHALLTFELALRQWSVSRSGCFTYRKSVLGTLWSESWVNPRADWRRKNSLPNFVNMHSSFTSPFIREEIYIEVTFQVLTAASMKMTVFGLFAVCLVEVYRRFRRQQAKLKRRWTSTRLHGTKTQKKAIQVHRSFSFAPMKCNESDNRTVLERHSAFIEPTLLGQPLPRLLYLPLQNDCRGTKYTGVRFCVRCLNGASTEECRMAPLGPKPILYSTVYVVILNW